MDIIKHTALHTGCT